MSNPTDQIDHHGSDRNNGDGKNGDGGSTRKSGGAFVPDESIIAAFDSVMIDDASSSMTDEFRGTIDIPASVKEGDFDPLDIRDRVVIKLVYDELIRIEHVEVAWHKWQRALKNGAHIPLWRVLAADESLNTEQIYAEAARVYSFKAVTISDEDLEQFLDETATGLSEDQWKSFAKLLLAPVAYTTEGSEPGRIIFATHDPARPDLFRKLKELGFKQFEVQYAPMEFVDKILDTFVKHRDDDFGFNDGGDFAYDLGSSGSEEPSSGLLDEAALDAEINKSALINLFEKTLNDAVRMGASDIHIYPNQHKQIEIRMRVNGTLNRWHVEDRVHPEAFLAVVKDNSLNVDRFERDKGQDGFIQRTIDGTVIRYRVSVIPIANQRLDVRSESIVIRVLDDRKVVKDLKKLGLTPLAMERFNWAIRQPYGMVILTGPTGSGKSTTLLASLNMVVDPKINVITVEDPVEYVIPEVRQVKLNHKFGLEDALRSILRHDPDVVMVGEMRDQTTAELAIKLANTGHLTFSTLHTNDAPSSVSRLFKMGVEPFLIAYAINLVVAQRLIRTLCRSCRVEEKPDAIRLEHVGFKPDEIANATFYGPGNEPGCKVCKGMGYTGRQAITETLPFTPEVRALIVGSTEFIPESELRELAIEQGMETLQDCARTLVLEGKTSVTEMMRVVFTGL